jgi:allantoate deiminase
MASGLHLPDPPLAAGQDTLAADVLARCDVLGAESERPGELTRTFLSAPMRRVHSRLSAWMAAAGMDVRLDPAGNLIGRYPGLGGEAAPAPAPVLMIGSHLDTVPDAGRYDGVLGVLLGVAAVEALALALGGRRLPMDVEVVGFVEEEGIRYRTPYIGSRAIAGRFDPAWMGRGDADGVTMADAYRAFGLDPALVGSAAYPPGRLAAYLEAHIEQGPVLESRGLPLGVATAIAGQSRLRVAFEGRAGHAGTSPMDLRRDALPAAAELVLEVERRARSVDGLRGTVGALAVGPGAVNVVPERAALCLDIRHADDPVRERAVADLLAFAAGAAARRGLGFRVDQAEHHAAVACAPGPTALLERAVAAAGVEPARLVSGAGHDAAVMAAVAPTALLFLRSPGGISHHRDERVLPGDVRLALDVMVRFVLAFAEGRRPPEGP